MARRTPSFRSLLVQQQQQVSSVPGGDHRAGRPIGDPAQGYGRHKAQVVRPGMRVVGIPVKTEAFYGQAVGNAMQRGHVKLLQVLIPMETRKSAARSCA